METGRKVMATKEKGRQWDGVSRPSDDLYRKNFDRIFKTNPVAKEVRTPKFKSKVIKNKKKDYFDSKSVKQMMDEME
jgi:hypothetical protein|tara:strand:+ start:1352 stop:1582 length:231 start_codon:yes stop_codon:yes gene_type:complete